MSIIVSWAVMRRMIHTMSLKKVASSLPFLELHRSEGCLIEKRPKQH